MRSTSATAVVTVAAALALVAFGCGDSERRDPGALGASGSGSGARIGESGSPSIFTGGTGADSSGGEAGTVGGSTATGGTTHGGGRGGSGGRGGAGGTGASGGSDAGMGATGDVASGASGGSAGAGAEGGEGGVGLTGGGATGGMAPIDQLSVCPTEAGTKSPNASIAFDHAVIADCRINWVTTLYYNSSIGLDDHPEYLAQLHNFNLALWGCSTQGPTTFDLIYKPAPLSQADAAVLIELYMAVATSELDLSPGEITDMRGLLERLSAPLLIDPDPGDLTQSRCQGGGDAGAGGAG